MRKRYVSIGKPEQGCINEDAAMATDGVAAVSDGAGGGGLFAERWSSYLLNHLPDAPITSFGELDAWIESIWEPFYDGCEKDAMQMDSLALDKFYDEGSFATLAAVWRMSANECRWMSFGDSVVFHYNYAKHELSHSFTSLADFDRPPYLINCKDELKEEGFRSGCFNIDVESVVFVTSDALAHYILMMYEVADKERFAEELSVAESAHTKNENYIRMAMSLRKPEFEHDVIKKLLNCNGHTLNFRRYTQSLIRKGLIASDDYSLAVL